MERIACVLGALFLAALVGTLLAISWGAVHEVVPVRPSKRRHRVVLLLGIAYPVALLVVALALRFGGERWWVTGVALYLPRLGFAAPLPLLVLALAASKMRRFLWTQAAAAFLVVFTLMGLTLPSPGAAADPSAPRLRVLSYNVNSDYGGTDHVVQEIDRYEPDVVLLQEIGDQEVLQREMRARYSSVTLNGQFLLATRYAILSSFEPDKLPIDGKLRSPRYIAQTIATPLGPIAVYDVHPLSPRFAFHEMRGHGLRREILSGRLFTGASAPAMLENDRVRAAQVEAFSQRAERESFPVIIGGDTNLPDLSYVLHRHLSRFQDGFVKAGSGFGYTFPSTARRSPWMRIDRILASDQLRFVRFEVGTSQASDHLCVVADLQRRPGGS